jgi:nucleoside-diphosphate-sugar epimerase
MKILIVGGTGLISSHIANQLLERGDEVTLFNRGRREKSFQGNLRSITGDRKNFAAFEARMAEAGPFDCVIDMVCFRSEEAESAVRAFGGRTDHYIFCSTVDVYVKPADRYPITESAGRGGAYPYAANKTRCEKVLNEAHDRGDLPVTVIRPAHTYADEGLIIFALGNSPVQLGRLRQGKPIVVQGDGNSFWVSCRSEDVARAFVNATGRSQTHGKAYHVAGEEWLTWNRYYEIVAKALEAPAPRLVHIPTEVLARIAPKRSGLIANNCWGNNIFDTTAARTDLDFAYTIPFLEGTKRTVAWLDRHEGIVEDSGDTFDDKLIAQWETLVERLPGEEDRRKEA